MSIASVNGHDTVCKRCCCCLGSAVHLILNLDPKLLLLQLLLQVLTLWLLTSWMPSGRHYVAMLSACTS